MNQNHGLSLLAGWVPLTLQVLAILAVLAVIVRSGKRWWLLWMPVAVAVGGIVFAGTAWYVDSEGLSDDPAPKLLWACVWIFGSVVAAMIAGFTAARWWRRVASVFAVALSALCVLVVLNQWVGYYPTVQAAWNAVTAGRLPDEVDASAIPALRNTAVTTGKVVAIDTGDTSGFRHRTEYVYLPPAWFKGATAPSLPAVMMIAGEFNTPADWMRSGDAATTADAYAKAHGGVMPVLVFVDAGGTFNNDTECVDGPRGQAASHLVSDVRPYVVKNFNVSAKGSAWGIIGWSMGGTCAVDLTVMHPDLFSAFVDIAGDVGPTAGTKDQTVTRLFDGDEKKWEAFDPATVMAKHGNYAGVSGWFEDTGVQSPRNFNRGNRPPGQHPQWRGGQWPGGSRPTATNASGFGGVDVVRDTGEIGAAAKLCTQGKAMGINCSVHTESSKHSWQFATATFAQTLPWLAQRLVL